jgi:hypothetical protein
MRAAVLAAATVACWSGPPVREVPPTVPLENGTRAAPYLMKPGAELRVILDTIVEPPPTFALDERADVVLTWTGGSEFSLTKADGISEWCEASPVVLPLATPGGYTAEVRAEHDGDHPKPVRLHVRALPPPAPTDLSFGRSVLLRPAPVTADDPRGPIADARLRVEAAGHVTLEVRARGSKATDLDQLSSLIVLDVYGPYGTMMTVRGAAKIPGAMELYFDAAPGDYTLRAFGGDGRATELEVVAAPLGPPVNPPATTAPPHAPSEVPRVRAGADLDVVVAEPPAPPRTWISIPDGHDLGLAWTPTDIELGVDHDDGGQLCAPTPCVVMRPAPGSYAISAFPAERHVWVDAHARLLALPEVAGTLRAGESLDVETRTITDDDPRGPVAEVIVDADDVGTYVVTAQDRGWVLPADWKHAVLPRLEVRALDGVPGMMGGMLTSLDQLRAGIGHTVIEVETPGKFLVRLDGTGAATPRRSLHVAVERR